MHPNTYIPTSINVTWNIFRLAVVFGRAAQTWLLGYNVNDKEAVERTDDETELVDETVSEKTESFILSQEGVF